MDCSFISKTEKPDSINVYWLGRVIGVNNIILISNVIVNRIMRKMKNSNHLYPGNAQFVEIVNANVIGKYLKNFLCLAGNKLSTSSIVNSVESFLLDYERSRGFFCMV